MTRRLLAVGLPISMQMVLEVSAFALTLIMMGWIGTVEQAAHQAVLSISNIVYMIIVRDLVCYHDYGQPSSIWCERLPGIASGCNGFMAFGISGQWIDNDLFYPISALAAADVHIR